MLISASSISLRPLHAITYTHDLYINVDWFICDTNEMLKKERICVFYFVLFHLNFLLLKLTSSTIKCLAKQFLFVTTTATRGNTTTTHFNTIFFKFCFSDSVVVVAARLYRVIVVCRVCAHSLAHRMNKRIWELETTNKINKQNASRWN